MAPILIPPCSFFGTVRSLPLDTQDQNTSSTPPHQITLPSSIHTTFRPNSPRIPSSSSNDPAVQTVHSFLTRSQEHLRNIVQPMTRTEFRQTYGHRLYRQYEWRWNGARRGERR